MMFAHSSGSTGDDRCVMAPPRRVSMPTRSLELLMYIRPSSSGAAWLVEAWSRQGTRHSAGLFNSVTAVHNCGQTVVGRCLSTICPVQTTPNDAYLRCQTEDLPMLEPLPDIKRRGEILCNYAEVKVTERQGRQTGNAASLAARCSWCKCCRLHRHTCTECLLHHNISVCHCTKQPAAGHSPSTQMVPGSWPEASALWRWVHPVSVPQSAA